MMNKTLITNLLLFTLLAACTSAVTPVPSQTPPTPTHDDVIPTVRVQITPTQVPYYTQGSMLIEQYQDVRFQNLSNINRDLGEAMIKTLWFDQSTKWTREDEQIAQNILKLGMNPGLGIRDLHKEGITGQGVTVAIIDQPLVLDHPEFQGKIIKYHDMGTNKPADFGSMHGPAVTSLLVGENIGTAPEAQVYFVAVPSWLLDAQYYADALDWIVEENEQLPNGNKIRAVSVSSIPSGIDTEYTNTDVWDAAYKRATEVGILVLDCTYEQGITVPCTYDLNDPDNVAKCIPNWTGPTDSPHKRINIPTRRTMATEEGSEGKLVYSYQYTGDGGLSWSVPYLTGVLAMGWQINPDLSNSQILELLYASAYKTDGPAGIINPKGFIDLVRLTVNE